MERFSNRFGLLALHALIWTLPVGLFAILALNMLAPSIPGGLYCLYEQPSVGQRFYFQIAVTTIALLYFAASTVAGSIRLPRHSVLGAAVLYALAATTSAAVARSPLFTLKETVFVWCCVLLLGIVVHLRPTQRQSRQLLTSLVLIAAVSAGYAVIQYLGLDIRWGLVGYSQEIKEARFHVLGLQGHPNYLTAFIGPALLICPGLIATAHNRIWQGILGSVMVVIALAILVSGTRSAWLGILFMGGALLALALREHRSFRLGRRGRIVAAALAVLLVLIVLQARHRYSFLDRIAEARPVQARLYFYLVATKMIAQHPLLGIGYNNYGVQLWDYIDELQSDAANSRYNYILDEIGGIRADQTHDEYLQIGAETGMVGLAAFFLLFSLFFRRLFGGYGRLERWSDRLLLAGVGAGVGFLLMDCLFSFPLRLPCSSLALWLLLGVGSCYAWAGEREAVGEPSNERGERKVRSWDA